MDTIRMYAESQRRAAEIIKTANDFVFDGNGNFDEARFAALVCGLNELAEKFYRNKGEVVEK